MNINKILNTQVTLSCIIRKNMCIGMKVRKVVCVTNTNRYLTFIVFCLPNNVETCVLYYISSVMKIG